MQRQASPPPRDGPQKRPRVEDLTASQPAKKRKAESLEDDPAVLRVCVHVSSRNVTNSLLGATKAQIRELQAKLRIQADGGAVKVKAEVRPIEIFTHGEVIDLTDD